MQTVVMDAVRIGVTAMAVILTAKFVFGKLVNVPGLSDAVMAV